MFIHVHHSGIWGRGQSAVFPVVGVFSSVRYSAGRALGTAQRWSTLSAALVLAVPTPHSPATRASVHTGRSAPTGARVRWIVEWEREPGMCVVSVTTATL